MPRPFDSASRHSAAMVTPPCPHPSGRSRTLLPGAIVLFAIVALLLHGPIAQLADYHHFADRRAWFGVANTADVLSNLGFGIVGAYGLAVLWRARSHPALRAGLAGYSLFCASLLLTAFGSSWYHLAPDNARLVFDRLPIALACAGLLAAVWNETKENAGHGSGLTAAMASMAIASVVWWRYTDLHGVGDLRPYLLLQALPLVLIPLLQYQSRRPPYERLAFGVAIGLYVLAKFCELADHAVLDALGFVSGHTLKHLFASLGAGVVVWHFPRRVKSSQEERFTA